MPIDRLRECVRRFTRLVDIDGQNEEKMIVEGRKILASLIAVDDWLPDFATEANEKSYRQYLLHCDPLERFSIVSFVWGPHQRTPIHNHTIWGLVGMLRGEEKSTRFTRAADGKLTAQDTEVMKPGDEMQTSNTKNMIFTVAQLIAFISESITLEPGDLVVTGTPFGVGFSRVPPIYLKDGDECVLEIDGLGRLSNKVREIA